MIEREGWGNALQAGGISGSIPEGLIGVLIDLTLLAQWALCSTQSPTEMSTRDISLGGKGGQSVGLQRNHLHVPIV